MAEPEIRITLDTKELDRLLAELQPRASQLLDKVAFDIEGDAKELAPVDTGNLKNSIQVDPEHGPLDRTIRASAEYAVHVEYGTSRMSAQPFLTPAVERNRKPFTEALRELLK